MSAEETDRRIATARENLAAVLRGLAGG